MLNEFLLAFALVGAAAALCYILNFGPFIPLIVILAAAGFIVTATIWRSNGRGKETGGDWVGQSESQPTETAFRPPSRGPFLFAGLVIKFCRARTVPRALPRSGSPVTPSLDWPGFFSA
jgi:hypothetical protein